MDQSRSRNIANRRLRRRRRRGWSRGALACWPFITFRAGFRRVVVVVNVVVNVVVVVVVDGDGDGSAVSGERPSASVVATGRLGDIRRHREVNAALLVGSVIRGRRRRRQLRRPRSRLRLRLREAAPGGLGNAMNGQHWRAPSLLAASLPQAPAANVVALARREREERDTRGPHLRASEGFRRRPSDLPFNLPPQPPRRALRGSGRSDSGGSISARIAGVSKTFGPDRLK